MINVVRILNMRITTNIVKTDAFLPILLQNTVLNEHKFDEFPE